MGPMGRRTRFAKMKNQIRHFLLSLLLILAALPAFGMTDQEFATINAGDQPAATAAGADAAPGMTGLVGRTIIALGAVLGLMAAAVWAARRWMPQVARTGGRQSIEILGQKMIGGRRALMLVRVRGRTLLLGATPQSIQTLSEFDSEPADWNELQAGGPSFEDELRRGTTNLE